MTRYFAAALFSLCFLSTFAPQSWSAPAGEVEVCFTPGQDCTGEIVREINSARQEILVQAYSFTSAPIAKALISAHKRGVKVEAILDKSQRSERYTSATFLRNAGVQVLIDGQHAIAHSKIMLFDRKTIVTGSFNFTKAAQEKNSENLLVIRGTPELVTRYLANYSNHRQHSEVY